MGRLHLDYTIIIWILIGQSVLTNAMNECQLHYISSAKSSPVLFHIHNVPVPTEPLKFMIDEPNSSSYARTCKLFLSALITENIRTLSVDRVLYIHLFSRNSVHIKLHDDLPRNSSTKQLIGYLVLNQCDMFWSDIARFGQHVDLRVIFTINASHRFEEDFASSDSLFNQSKILPSGLENIGSYSIVGYNESLSEFPSVFTDYKWPLMTEIAFDRATFTDIPQTLSQTMPELQSVEIRIAPQLKLPKHFPWNTYEFDLPRNLSRTANGNDHYDRNFRVKPNVYRRLLSWNQGNITDIGPYQFSGFLHSITVKSSKVENVHSTAFVQTTKLQHIDLSDNLIGDIPVTLFHHLISLTYLNFHGNKVSHFHDDTFTNLPSLQVVILSKNRIFSIQSKLFRYLPQLVTLDVSRNIISSIADDFLDTESSSMRHLLASKNKLCTIPEASLFLRNSEVIDLSSNALDFNSIEILLANFSEDHFHFQHKKDSSTVVSGTKWEDLKTKRLDLSYNNITTLNIGSMNDEHKMLLMEGIGRYFSIDMSENPIHCDCKIYDLHKVINTEEYHFNEYNVGNWKCQSPTDLKGKPIAAVEITDFWCPVDIPDCPEECICYNRTYDGLIKVNCSNQALDSLPSTIPANAAHLIVRNAGLCSLAYPPTYLTSLAILDLSHNNISYISDGFAESVSMINGTVRLNSNRLAYFPGQFQKVNLSVTELTVGSNPIKCDCHSSWVKDWLLDNFNDKLINSILEVVCASGVGQGEAIIRVADNAFICEEILSAAYRNLAIILACIIGVMVISLSVGYRWRFEFKALVYKHLNWRPFDGSDMDIEDRVYDCIISYSDFDYKWVCHVLRKKLESEERGFKCCLHDRDFLAGRSVSENIQTCMAQSRRMVMVLSRNFIKSSWCMMEFRNAHLKVMKEMSKYLIVILFEDIHENEMEDELKFYMKHNTYLSIQNKWFWDKLYYAMPEIPICKLKPEIAKPMQLKYEEDVSYLEKPWIKREESVESADDVMV